MSGVWVATTIFRAEPRWDEHGMANLETFVDGVASTEALARAFARECSDQPTRWYRSSRRAGGATAGHHDSEGIHFHQVERRNVATRLDGQGWPRP